MCRLHRLVGEVSCRLLAAARSRCTVLAESAKAGADSRPLAVSRAIRIRGSGGVSCASGSLGDALRPSRVPPRRSERAATAIRQTAHLPASGARQAQRRRSSPFGRSGSPVRSWRWLGFGLRAASADLGSTGVGSVRASALFRRLVRPAYAPVAGGFRLTDVRCSRAVLRDVECASLWRVLPRTGLPDLARRVDGSFGCVVKRLLARGSSSANTRRGD